MAKKSIAKKSELRKILDSLKRKGYNVGGIDYSEFDLDSDVHLECGSLYSTNLKTLDRVFEEGVHLTSPKTITLELKTKKPTAIRNSLGVNLSVSFRVVSLDMNDRKAYCGENGNVTDERDYKEIEEIFKRYGWEVKNEGIRIRGISPREKRRG